MTLTANKIETFLLVLFLLALPLDRRHTFQIGSTIDSKQVHLYASDLALILLLGWACLTGNIRRWKTTWYTTWCVGIFLFLAFLSAYFLSPRETFTWYWLAKTVELAVLYLYFRNVPRGITHVVMKTTVFAGLCQSLIAVGQFLMQHSLGLGLLGEPSLNSHVVGVAKINTATGKLIRGYGTFPHPNPLSAFLLVACATAIYLTYTAMAKRERLTWNIAGGIIMFGIFATFSRAAIAILGLIIIVFLLYHVKKGDSKSFLLRFCSIGVIAFIIFLPNLRNRVELNTPTNYNRSFYNQIGFSIFKEHPIFGVGIGNTLNHVEQRITKTENWQIQPPHNYFIIVACETGIIGLIFILYFFAKQWQRLYKRGVDADYRLYLSVVFGTIIILMFFDHYFYTTQQTQLLLWMTMGLITATSMVN